MNMLYKLYKVHLNLLYIHTVFFIGVAGGNLIALSIRGPSSWLIGMAYYSLRITGLYTPLYLATNQGGSTTGGLIIMVV